MNIRKKGLDKSQQYIVDEIDEMPANILQELIFDPKNRAYFEDYIATRIYKNNPNLSSSFKCPDEIREHIFKSAKMIYDTAYNFSA